LADDIFTSLSVTQEILRTMAQCVELVQTVSQQQAKLISLRTLASGPTVELNNPAAAAGRSNTTVTSNISSVTIIIY
jgi:hypothetical protein